MRLKPLSLLLGVITVLITAPPLSYQLYRSWAHQRDGHEALRELNGYLHALKVMQRYSEERRPVIATLGTAGNTAHSSEQLRLYQQRSTAAEQTFARDHQDLPAALSSIQHRDVLARYEAAHLSMQNIRRDVERLRGEPLSQRSDQEIADTFHSLFAIIDILKPAEALLNQCLRQRLPGNAGELNAVSYLTHMREYAGQQGAITAVALIGNRPLRPGEIEEIRNLDGRMETLHTMLHITLGNSLEKDPALAQAEERMENLYFNEASEIDHGQQRHHALTTHDLTTSYAARIDSIINLRDRLLERVQQDASRQARLAEYTFAATLAAFALILASLLIILHQFERRVVSPLLGSTRALVALARGRLNADFTPPNSQDEVGDMHRAMAILRHQLEHRNQLECEREILIAELKEQATLDYLTRVYNRQTITHLGYELLQDPTGHGTLAAILFDIDHFKSINDTLGHAAGDQVLIEIAARCRTAQREADLLGRYGGEEFLFYCQVKTLDEAVNVAERLRKAISETPFTHGNVSLTVTASFGVALHLPDEPLEALTARADGALYQAKHNGRNQVYCQR